MPSEAWTNNRASNFVDSNVFSTLRSYPGSSLHTTPRARRPMSPQLLPSFSGKPPFPTEEMTLFPWMVERRAETPQVRLLYPNSSPGTKIRTSSCACSIFVLFISHKNIVQLQRCIGGLQCCGSFVRDMLSSICHWINRLGCHELMKYCIPDVVRHHRL